MVIIFDDRMDIWVSFVIESIESVFYDCERCRISREITIIAL